MLAVELRLPPRSRPPRHRAARAGVSAVAPARRTMVVCRSSHYAVTGRPSSRVSVTVVGRSRTPLSTPARSYVVVLATCSRAPTSVRASTLLGWQVLVMISRQEMKGARRSRPCRLREGAADWVVAGRRTTYPLLVEDRGEDPRRQVTRTIAVPSSHRLEENMVVAERGQRCQGSIEGRTAPVPAWADHPRSHQCGRTRRRSRDQSGFVHVVGPGVASAFSACRY